MLPVQAGNPFPAKGWGAFLTTGRTTDGGAAHGDQSSKEWRKERETERKSPQIIRNHAKKFYMPFRIVGVVGSNPIRSTTSSRTAYRPRRRFLFPRKFHANGAAYSLRCLLSPAADRSASFRMRPAPCGYSVGLRFGSAAARWFCLPSKNIVFNRPPEPASFIPSRKTCFAPCVWPGQFL